MATKMYTRGRTGASTHRGTNTANAAGVNKGWYASLLSTTAGASLLAASTPSTTGPTNGVEQETTSIPYEYLSDPLSADFTISGTITFNVWAAEGTMTDNAGAQCIVEKVSAVDGSITTVVNSERAVEAAITTRAVNNWTATPTSTAFNRGDRIRTRWLANDAGGTMNAGSLSIGTDGPTGAADGDSWVQFTENLTFETIGVAAGTQLFLTTTSAGINPGAATELEAWTSRGSGSTNSVTNTAAGWTAGIQITDTAGGTALEWYSKQLNAFTLGGLASCNIRGLESSASANASLACEIAICNSDGSGATVWGVGRIVPIGSPARSELGTSDAANTVYVAGDDVSVTNGQRLRIRLYIDDTNDIVLATGFTSTISYAGTSAAAAGDSYIILPQSITEFSPASDTPSLFDRRTPRRRMIQRI